MYYSIRGFVNNGVVKIKLSKYAATLISVPGVEKDEFEVEAGAEHEHVTVKFDLCDGAAWQRVADGNESSVLVAAVEWRRVQGALAYLQVPAAVYHLYPAHQHNSCQAPAYNYYSWYITNDDGRR